MPADYRRRDLVTDRKAQHRRVTAAGDHSVADATLDSTQQFAVIEEGYVLFPGKPHHNAKSCLLGLVQKPTRWRHVGANAVEALGRHVREILLNNLRGWELTTILRRAKGSVGNPLDPELFVAHEQELAGRPGARPIGGEGNDPSFRYAVLGSVRVSRRMSISRYDVVFGSQHESVTFALQ